MLTKFLNLEWNPQMGMHKMNERVTMLMASSVDMIF